MFTYLPPGESRDRPLVVVLHGCTQTAAGYDRGAGWSTLARRYGFALLFPEQQRVNNPNNCFNWFQLVDTERDCGEALSIWQMIEKMTSDAGIDRQRVFVTGLSAGGAMTSVMLATYPEVFAGGAIIAGLPYGAAANIPQAFASMRQCAPRPASSWGDLVRGASAYAGPWPRVSVWHGGADTTVAPSNAAEIVKQWTNVHGLPTDPSLTDAVDGFPRQVWLGPEGQEVIESYTIPSMAHGTPIAAGDDCDQCGAAGAFLLDVGISSSYHIVKFWGLTHHPVERATEADRAMEQAQRGQRKAHHFSEDATGGERPGFSRSRSTTADFDIGATIANALKAAGLMKSAEPRDRPRDNAD
jgi:feruloyl esterase